MRNGRSFFARRRALTALTAALAALLTAVGTVPARSATAAPVQISVVGNRADLVSGGQALVDVQLPAGTRPSRVRVAVGGRDVTSAFALRPNGRFQGLVTGLAV